MKFLAQKYQNMSKTIKKYFGFHFWDFKTIYVKITNLLLGLLNKKYFNCSTKNV